MGKCKGFQILFVMLLSILVFVLLVICGLAYPLLLTGVSQVIMPEKAEGSLLENKAGEKIGSRLIGQSFSDPGYFHGRVSSINYDAAGSM